MAEYSYVKKWFPEIESLQISPNGTTIIDSDGHSLGTDPGRAFEGLLSGRRDPGVTGIGETTLLRALITRMAKDGQSPDFSRSALVSLGNDRTSLLGKDSGGENNADALHGRRSGGNETGRDLATNALYSSPAPGEFSFNQTTDAGDKNQKGFNFDALEPGPNAKFIENTQKAYDTAATDKARENIAEASAKREGLSRGKVQNVPQGMMDFGMSGSFGTKVQPSLFNAEPNQPANFKPLAPRGW